ncbi:hypothetical protein TcG_02279 [Trypanosoma cruzi]|nr:hypothetical protein TcG_02279 [Trypanosoma cruzi]
MGSRRRAKRPSSAATEVAEKKVDEEANTKEAETTTFSPKVSEHPASESNVEQPPALPLPAAEEPEAPAVAPAPKPSRRALQRLRGWEPVIKPPEGMAALPASPVVPTADVVWLDNSRRVTLIPNSGGGVHTRRGAANLAAVSPPTSYFVCTRDPLIKLVRAGTQSVHVITSLPPGGDPCSILDNVTSASSFTQRSGEAVTRGSNITSSFSSLSCFSRPREGLSGDSEGEGGEETGMGDEEELEEANGTNADARAASCRTQPSNKAVASTNSAEYGGTEADVGKGKKNATLKKSGNATPAATTAAATAPPTRIGVLSPAQAMLPPPYRRMRRLKRKLHITEETPAFAIHSELRDKMPQLFPKAPFSTEEDVLRSTIDWCDDITLMYTRLLWEFAPDEFLKRALQNQQQHDNEDNKKPKLTENLLPLHSLEEEEA